VIGSEMSGGARNIFVSDCTFMGTDIGLRFKTVRGRGGIVEKIWVKDIRMKDIVHQAIFLDMYYFAKAPTLAESKGAQDATATPPVTIATPQFRDIHISNIVCDGAEEGIFVRGLPEMSIQDIYLENMTLKTNKGAELIAAKNISLKNIDLQTRNTDPVIYIENSSSLKFDAIRYNKAAGLLFSVNGDNCKNILVTHTDVSGAVKKAAFNYGAGESTLEVR
jgi:polygalacturonase